jgi:hypothetical protein
LYHDESQFRQYKNGKQYHWAPANRVGMTEAEKSLQFDDGKSNGQPGKGFSVCTVISVDPHTIVKHRDDRGEMSVVGWAVDAQKYAKDDHESFLLSVTQAIEAQQALAPDKITVLVVDGALTHTTVSGGRTPSNLNLKAGGS